MKEVQVTLQEAFDGTRFDSKEACQSYEDANFVLRFVGLRPEQVVAALDRTDADLADAFEKAGMEIRALRYARGEFRRRGAVPKGDLPPSMPDAADLTMSPEERRVHDYCAHVLSITDEPSQPQVSNTEADMEPAP